MDATAISTFINAGRSAISLFKEVKELLPDGKQKTEAINKIEEAERALQIAEAKAAKEMGYQLCKCTFPPQIMLFDKAQNIYKCQNPACGYEEPVRYDIRRGSKSFI